VKLLCKKHPVDQLLGGAGKSMKPTQPGDASQSSAHALAPVMPSVRAPLESVVLLNWMPLIQW